MSNLEAKQGILDYTTGKTTSTGLNATLRSEAALSEVDAAQLAVIDAAIAASPSLNQDTILYRGIFLPDLGVEQTPPDYSSMSVGETTIDSGFVSTSANSSLIENLVENTPNSQLLEIHASSGAQVLNVNQVLGAQSPEPAQNEFILPRGSVFVVAQQLPDRTILSLVSKTRTVVA